MCSCVSVETGSVSIKSLHSFKKKSLCGIGWVLVPPYLLPLFSLP